MSQVHYAVCNLCEAICGLAIEHDGERIVSIRGDEQDPFSRGHICPKAVALQDIHADPDRLRRPVVRRGTDWEVVSWDEALDVAGRGLAAIQREHGRDAVAFYFGNPTAHDYAASLAILPFIRRLGTRNIYSANSVDALPRLLTSFLLYGSQAVIPIPDLDRTDFLLVLGANPAVSNGSVMTAPDAARRLRRIRERGGKVVVVDPRRTETAALADEHHFIRPGGDALLLLAMLEAVLSSGSPASDRLLSYVDGIADLRELVARFPAERVAGRVGIGAETIRRLARELAESPSAVCYGRVGTCVQAYGTLATWLIDVLNIVTGNLDRPGGAMFTTPAVDLPAVARWLRQTGHFDRWRSRVGGLPEFNGELPVAALADEIETPGSGQVRALITHAGNPVLSSPNGRRLDDALAGLELMVAIDFYINETTRHATVILPPASALERDHYPLIFHALAVRNTARYSRALFPPPEGSRDGWEILADLQARMARHGGLSSRLRGRLGRWMAGALSPRRQIALLLRLGPHRLSLRRLEQEPHGVDLGPLEPRLPRLLNTRKKRIALVPEVMVGDLGRLEAELAAESVAASNGDLVLIGRRTLRSNNSWMHNSKRLVRGKDRCTLLMHPSDAERIGLESGDRVRIASRVGELRAPLEVSDDIMPGVVSLPHGWGHDRPGVRLRVAGEHAGASVNDLTDERFVDVLSGTCSLNGVPVTVQPRDREPEPHQDREPEPGP